MSAAEGSLGHHPADEAWITQLEQQFAPALEDANPSAAAQNNAAMVRAVYMWTGQVIQGYELPEVLHLVFERNERLARRCRGLITISSFLLVALVIGFIVWRGSNV